MFSSRLCTLSRHNQHLTCCCLNNMPESKPKCLGDLHEKEGLPSTFQDLLSCCESKFCVWGLQAWLMHLPELLSPAAGHVPPGSWAATVRGDFWLMSQVYRFMVCGPSFIAGCDVCCIFRASVRDGRGSNVWCFLGMCSKFRLFFPDFKSRFSLPDLPCHVEISQQNDGSSAPGDLMTRLISNWVWFHQGPGRKSKI